MPELPEVETALRGIAPCITDQTILEVVFRTDKLRQPLDVKLCRILPGQTIRRVVRRAKYLLLFCTHGTVLLHLGMSGTLRVVPAETTEQKHDHIDLVFGNGECLRFTDPRKFGTFVYTATDPYVHRLLRDLGPEPLAEMFSGAYLYRKSRRKTLAVKPFLMDQKVVVGVGNIYANEALFRAGIRPSRAAGQVGREAYDRLAAAVRAVLTEAIEAGGTTISDFRQHDGRPGYFTQQLRVYGRAGEGCVSCGRNIVAQVLGQRSTYFCPSCQR